MINKPETMKEGKTYTEDEHMRLVRINMGIAAGGGLLVGILMGSVLYATYANK